MAWSERLPSGRYRGLYRDKRQKVRSVGRTFTQPAEAKRAAAVKEDSIRRPGAVQSKAGRMTWSAWCDQWLDTRDVEPGTQANDDSRIRRHLRPYWGDVRLDEITRDDVEEWVETLTKTPKHQQKAGKGKSAPLAPRTVLKIVNLFSVSLSVAAGPPNYLIEFNPCAGVEIKKAELGDEYFMTRAEVELLKSHAPDDTTRMIVDLGTETGLRWGEIIGLHRKRIDLDALRITVQEVHSRASSEIKPYPKGRKRRGVPITAELGARLRTYMAANPGRRCTTRHRHGSRCVGPLLFSTKTGTAIDYGDHRTWKWLPMVEAAEMSGVTPHDMRHTYASWLIQDGVDIAVVSRLLGHASIKTTERYTHLGEARWDDVRAVLGGRSASTPDEAAIRAAVQQLAEAAPDKWGAVVAALGDQTGEAAPNLPHGEGGNVVSINRRSRSAG